jgi:actin-related protein
MKSYSALAFFLVLFLLNITISKKLKKTKQIDHNDDHTVVLDMDDLYTYVGFSNYEDFFLKIPTAAVYSSIDEGGVMVGSGGYFFDDQVFYRHGTVLRPIEHGKISSYFILEKFLDYLFYSKLKIDPNYRLLMTTNILFSKYDLEKISSLMFNKYKFSGVLLRTSSKLVIDASETSTAIVCELKYNTINVVPYEEGNSLNQAIAKSDLSINSLIDHIVEIILVKTQTKLHGTKLKYAAEDILINLFYVAENFEQEKQKFNNSNNSSYKLSSGDVLTFGMERFTIPELLFDPTLVKNNEKIEQKGIHLTIKEAIMKSPAEIRKNLYENIILSGQYANIPGLARRLEKELSALEPNIKIQVLAPNNSNSGFNAALRFAASEANNASYMRREHYDPLYVYRYFME